MIINIAEQSTKNAIAVARRAEEIGANGLMLSPPMCYKATDHETILYFTEIAKNTSLPIMIHNNPVDYKIEVTLEMLTELIKNDNIQAVKESIRDNSEASAYLAQSSVAYETASGNWRQKIGFQKWIGLYNRPFDAWTEIRRFDFPKLTAPIEAISGFPNRYTYPSNEQQLNNANYKAASSAIGGDKVETKLFWDIY